MPQGRPLDGAGDVDHHGDYCAVSQEPDVGSSAGAVAMIDRLGSDQVIVDGVLRPPTRSPQMADRATPFPAPARRTVHAVLWHTAHRRRSPPVFGLPRQSRKGLGATTVPDKSIRPMRFGD